MEEQVISGSTTPTVVSAEPVVSQNTTDDIIARASKFVEDNAPKNPVVDKVDFNSQELDKLLEGVTDPVIKEQLIKKSKSLESGFNRKFQDLAEIRKQLEKSQQWTPERVQSLLQDPQFVQAAQSIVPSTPPDGMTTEEYSQLTDTEKQKLASMEQELGFLKSQQLQTLKKEEDARLIAKYSDNYKPEAIDSLLNDMMQGRRIATREDIFKVIDYENMAKRVYAMAMSDKNNKNQERINASVVPSGASIVPNSDVPKQSANQSSKQYFVELGKRRLAEAKQMAGAK